MEDNNKKMKNKKEKLTLAYIISLPPTCMILAYIIGDYFFGSSGRAIGLVFGYLFSIYLRKHKE